MAGLGPKPVPSKPSAPAKRPAGVKPADPYANPGQYIDKAVSRLGAPLTDAQIQASAQGQLSPLVQALTDSIGRQAQSGTAAIGGYTNALAASLKPFQQNAANIYGGAQQSQAASDAALSAKLAGGGAQQAQDLGAKLAGINAPTATGAAVQDATQTATGAGNALYATGSASLADLIAQGAAEQSYASKLPGIAGLQGGQQVGGLQQQLAGRLADQTGALQAKVPDIVSGLQGQRSDLLGNREKLRADLQGFFSDREMKQQALAQERQALGLKADAAQTSAQQGAARIAISQQNANTSAARAQTAAETARVNAAYKKASLGITEAKLQASLAKEAALAKAKGQHLGLSAKDWSKYNALALSGARSAHNGTPDGTHPPISWQQFLTIGTGQGIPVGVLIEQGKRVYSQKEIKQGLIPKAKG